MQLFIVIKDSKKGEGRQVWAFTQHADALKCRQLEKLPSNALVGCSVDAYVDAAKMGKCNA